MSAKSSFVPALIAIALSITADVIYTASTCLHGGTCVDQSLDCICTLPYTGSDCSSVIPVSAADNLAQLKSLAATLPDPVAFWPLSTQFSLLDAGPNKIDGALNGSVTTVVGPFGLVDTGVQTGNGQYITYVSNLFPTLGGSSGKVTIGLFVNYNGPIPFIEFNTTTYLFQYSTGIFSVQYGAAVSDEAQVSCSGLANGWTFVALQYDGVTNMVHLFCDGSLSSGISLAAGASFQPASVLTAGLRSTTATASVACLSIYTSLLNTTQLANLVALCQHYQSIVCSPGCLPDTCRADVNATNGYTCSSCLPGWAVSHDCTIPICTSPCLHNGTCTSPDFCTCLAGYTGATCSVAVCDPPCLHGGTCATPNACQCATGYEGAACETPICTTPCTNGLVCSAPDTCACPTSYSDNLVQLKCLASQLQATPIGYWPLSSQFALRDATSNELDGVYELKTAPSATGPFGVANTAMRTSNTNFISFTSSLLGGSSMTIATWVDMSFTGNGPILLFPNGAQLWQTSDNTLYTIYYSSTSTRSFIRTCSGLVNGWNFVGLVHDGSTKNRYLYCNGTFSTADNLGTETSAFLASNFRIGRFISSYSNASFACPTVFNVALNASQLSALKEMCKPYQSIACSANCAADTCRADITAAKGYRCSSCLTGWASSDCSINTANAAALQTAASSLPDPVGYWPLSSQFSLRDAGPNGIDGVFVTASGSVVSGPFGLPDTGIETAKGKYFAFTSVFFTAMSSLTMAVWVNMNSPPGPILVFDNGAQLWQSADGTLMAKYGSKAPEFTLACPGLATGWIFVALIHDGTTTSERYLYCDGTLSTVDASGQTLVVSSDLRVAMYSGTVSTASFACLSVYDVALTEDQLGTVKLMCSNFESITCSVNCQPDTCRADPAATNGFSCSSCVNGWSSSDCSFPICTTPCSNSGTCRAPDTCACTASYKGSTCDIPLCNPSCSNGGTCSAPNTCQCPTGYNGTICDSPVCNSTCRNGGSCSAPYTCTCPTTYSGSFCETIVCYHGATRLGNNTCLCPATYSGKYCSIPICTNPCQNGGTCSSPDICTCPTTFTGATCTIPVCSPACQNGGTCLLNRTCSCPVDFTGSTCFQPLCTPSCFNGGTCIAPNNCSCPATYNDATCSTPICNPSCKNGGTCSAVDTCTCTSQYTGSTCIEPVCNSPCLNNGNCSAPDTCTCTVTYIGETCQTPVCNSPCLNGGTCSAPDTCACPATYTDATCSTPVCNSNCQNGGTCTAPDTCFCTNDYNGLTCSDPVCNPTCQNGGTCSSPNVCTCDPSSYTGSYCETPVCSQTCLNGGSCTSPNTCTCLSGFNGTACETTTCSQPCQNGGSCTGANTCTCTIDWEDSVCSTPICSSGCANGGSCVDPNTCLCATGWTDGICSTPICSTPCENGGSCTNPDICTCNPDFKGPTCNLTFCDPNCTALMTDMSFIANVSDEILVLRQTEICDSVMTASKDLNLGSSPTAITAASAGFLSSIGDQMKRFSQLGETLEPTQVANILTAYSTAGDVVMSAVNNKTEAEPDPVDKTQSVPAECVKPSMTTTIDPLSDGNPNVGTESSVVPLTINQKQHLYDNLVNMMDTMMGMVTEALAAGKDYEYSGTFFAAKVVNVALEDLSGLEVTNSLAKANMPKVGNATDLFLNPPPSLYLTSKVSFALTAYIANVYDATNPCNMPTISTKVTHDGTPLVLNPHNPVRLTGTPAASKTAIFSSKKAVAQCSLSSISCDPNGNAAMLGSLAGFPIKLSAGDFVLIFAADPFNYTAYLAFNSTPNPTSFIWALNVTGNETIVTTNLDYSEPTVKFNSSTELRVVISRRDIVRYHENATAYGASEDSAISLKVLMKRDFSAFSGQGEMPEAVCEIQQCSGYHFRIAPALSSSSKRRKRDADSNSTEDFELDPDSSEGAVSFTSNYFGEFGADMVITPNTIEFSNIFANFATLLADNYAVFAVMIAAVVLFVVGVVISQRFDRSDLQEWAFLPIRSNRRDERYGYLISVSHFDANLNGQKPRVSIRLFGDIQDSAWRLLEDGKRKNFDGKHPANFYLSTLVPLGQLEAIELELAIYRTNDFISKPLEIYMDKVNIVDVKTGKKFMFLVKKKMLAGQMQRAELATEDDVKGFRYLVSSHSRIGLSQSHPWLSAVKRPLPSNWTRVERLACVVSALFMAMLVNAMFYGKETESSEQGIKIGPIRITWFTIWTSMIGSVIIVPPTTIMAVIFKKIRRRSAEQSQFLTVFNVKLPETVGEGSTKEKKQFQLPWQCVFIAWFLVGACVGASAFFVIMYSLSWGREKSLQWLTGIALHCVQDIIIIQSVKVVIMSVFSSTFLSLPEDGVGIGKLTLGKSKTPKQQTQLFKRARNTLAGIMHHLVYVIAFTLVIATAHNWQSYQQVRDLSPLVAVPGYQPITGVIADHSAVYSYLQSTLLPNFLNGNQFVYGGIFKSSKFYNVRNHDVLLLGPIRLRQQRTVLTSCIYEKAMPFLPISFRKVNMSDNMSCQKPFSSDLTGLAESSEIRSFNYSWFDLSPPREYSVEELKNLTTNDAPWIYRDSDGTAYSGWQANYKTGGYYVDLPLKLSSASAVIAALEQRRWLDNATTVLFVDFVLYNAQVNVFVAVKVVFEALSAGGMAYHKWLYPLNLYQYSGSNAMLTLGVQAIWIAILVTHAIKTILRMKKQGCGKFFKDGWNIFDIFHILLSFGIVGLFGARIYVVIGKINQMQTFRKEFTSLDLLVQWEDLMLNLYGIDFFMAMLLFFRHLYLNKFWAMFLGTLAHGGKDILSFIFVLVLITAMFAGFGNITMSATCNEFRSFSASFITLIQNIIGVVGPLLSLAQTSRFVMAFCSAYSTIVMFMSVQIFMAIINTVYGIIASNVESMTQWDLDLADYLSQQWHAVVSLLRNKSAKDDADVDEMPGDNFEKFERTIATLERMVDRAMKMERRQQRYRLAWAAESECRRKRRRRLPPRFFSDSFPDHSTPSNANQKPFSIPALREGYLNPQNQFSSQKELHPMPPF